MKRIPVADMTDEQLVERFVAIALEQDRAAFWDEVTSYNSLFDKMEEVEKELRTRPGDGRHALIALLEHENAHVRLKAAIATLALAPEAARATLEVLIDRNIPPEATDARSMLRSIAKGRYVPT